MLMRIGCQGTAKRFASASAAVTSRAGVNSEITVAACRITPAAFAFARRTALSTPPESAISAERSGKLFIAELPHLAHGMRRAGKVGRERKGKLLGPDVLTDEDVVSLLHREADVFAQCPGENFLPVL